MTTIYFKLQLVKDSTIVSELNVSSLSSVAHILCTGKLQLLPRSKKHEKHSHQYLAISIVKVAKYTSIEYLDSFHVLNLKAINDLFKTQRGLSNG